MIRFRRLHMYTALSFAYSNSLSWLTNKNMMWCDVMKCLVVRTRHTTLTKHHIHTHTRTNAHNDKKKISKWRLRSLFVVLIYRHNAYMYSIWIWLSLAHLPCVKSHRLRTLAYPYAYIGIRGIGGACICVRTHAYRCMCQMLAKSKTIDWILRNSPRICSSVLSDYKNL